MNPNGKRGKARSKFGPEQEVFLMLFLVISIIAWATAQEPESKAEAPVRKAEAVEEPLPTQITLRDDQGSAFFGISSVAIGPDFGKRLEAAAEKLDLMARQHGLDALEVVGFADGSLMHPGTASGSQATPSFSYNLSNPHGDFDCLAGAWLQGGTECQVPYKILGGEASRIFTGTVPAQDFSNKRLVAALVNSNIELGMLRAMAVIRHLRILRESDRSAASGASRPMVLEGIREFLPLSAGSFTSERYTLTTVMDGRRNEARRRIDLRLFSLKDRNSEAAR